VRGRVRPGFAADTALWRSLLRDTLVYGAANALGVVYFQIAVIAMSVLSTDRETSYYALAFRVLELVNVVPFLLATSAFPLLARAAGRDADRLRYALGRMFDVALIVGGLATIGFVVGAPFAVALLGGDELAPSVPVLRTMGAALVASFLIAVWAHALLSLRRHAALLVANAGALLLALVLSVVLLPSGGARAGALVTVALELALAVGYALALALGRRDLLPSPRIVPRWLAALGAALAVGLLVPVHSVVATALAAALYLALIAAARALPRELLEAVRGH
jgi:O-antigen/teichoic acid export membrane protein